jgi:hypothetical protein
VVSVEALVRQAEAAGLRLAADGGRLVIRGPRAAETLATALLLRKTDVLNVLASPRVICAYFVGNQPVGPCGRCAAPYEAHVWPRHKGAPPWTKPA